MTSTWFLRFILTILILLAAGCSHHATVQGQQYGDEQFSQPLNPVQLFPVTPVNISDYQKQIALIKATSPSLYCQYHEIYLAIAQWLKQNPEQTHLNQVGLTTYELAGQDNWGNTHLTGYYTPVLKARHKPDDTFRYPLYAKPVNGGAQLPSRAEIYQGALAGQGLELAYTSSLIDNFIMEVQGSGYIDFENGEPLVFFSYAGKNNRAYQSIGRLLVEQGEIPKKKISMQAIKGWAEKQRPDIILNLLQQNESFVFFVPKFSAPVIGASGIPLVAKAAVASDRSLIPSGSVLLVEVPLLNEKGVFNGQRELRLMTALDVGGAIKGHHLDIYQGIGHEAGELAGFYNHYGRVWLIQPAKNSHLNVETSCQR
ncbi:murein transglycosylase A [Utexia brackfieldae]|uniref:murein transglycosylase A n=1 Tax=Utexia brackfieldae TaxID=3074108 RepID=UPI00370D3E0D